MGASAFGGPPGRWLAALALLGVAGAGCNAAAPASALSFVARPPGDLPAPSPKLSWPDEQVWRFTEVARAAGLTYTHEYDIPGNLQTVADTDYHTGGGVACGDYDGDGLLDLYVARGNLGPNLLLRNKGDGTFEDVAPKARVDLMGVYSSGPVFADVNGDGRLDLVVGGVGPSTARIFLQQEGGVYADASNGSGIEDDKPVLSVALGDYDRDGWLDLALARWGATPHQEHLYRNDGQGHFVPTGLKAGLDYFGRGESAGDWSHTLNFADIDNDGWPDILATSDYRTSRYYLNTRDGGFTHMMPPVIDDANGMGAAIADYDNDGLLDWFVTSIDDPTQTVPPQDGNRLYHNLGGGRFEDTSAKAGVRPGYWGWAACFADFNNDGNLDLFHVNGMRVPITLNARFFLDPSRLFLANGDGTFAEKSHALGLDDTGQGRGVVCFDYDNDGDIDVLVANNAEPPALWRNDLPARNHWLRVRLRGVSPNTQAIGGRIYVTAGGLTQMREIRAGTNFVSQDPVDQHFGLGAATTIDKVRAVFPDGSECGLTAVEVDQAVVIDHP